MEFRNKNEFLDKLARDLEFRLREAEVKVEGHCPTCSCNPIRMLHLSTLPDVYVFVLAINGNKHEIAYNPGAEDGFRLPTEEEWNKIVWAVILPPLTMTAVS